MACLLFCRCAFFENNNCIHFTVCASLSDLDYLRKVETEPTKVLMLDSNHQVRADGLLMSVLMKVQGQVCNLSWYLLYTTIQPRARLSCSFILLHVLCIHPVSSSVKPCQLTLQALLRYCGLISKYVQTLLTVKLFSRPFFLLP